MSLRQLFCSDWLDIYQGYLGPVNPGFRAEWLNDRLTCGDGPTGYCLGHVEADDDVAREEQQCPEPVYSAEEPFYNCSSCSGDQDHMNDDGVVEMKGDDGYDGDLESVADIPGGEGQGNEENIDPNLLQRAAVVLGQASSPQVDSVFDRALGRLSLIDMTQDESDYDMV